jgi:hypothetical protein
MNQLNKMDDIMMDEFVTFCKESCEQHPHFSETIMDYFDLAMDEMEQGGSQQHEIELAVNDIQSVCGL